MVGGGDAFEWQADSVEVEDGGAAGGRKVRFECNAQLGPRSRELRVKKGVTRQVLAAYWEEAFAEPTQVRGRHTWLPAEYNRK